MNLFLHVQSKALREYVYHVHFISNSRSSPLPEQSYGSKSSACANLSSLIFVGLCAHTGTEYTTQIKHRY